MLNVTGMVKHFSQGRAAMPLRAVDGVSLTLGDGEILGLTGESGCGKSTLARSILRFTEPDEGTVVLDGTEVTALSRKELLKFRPKTQLISQDAESAFNPRQSIGASASEPFRVLHGASPEEALEMSEEYFTMAGFDPRLAGRFPFELSGGQLQRAAVARALECSPSLLVADEPTSALDPSAQAHVVRLFQRINSEHGVSILWISHDILLLSCVCDRIAVMHGGKIMEYGPSGEILENPAHPVTRSLVGRITGNRYFPADCTSGNDLSDGCAICAEEDSPFIELEDGHAVRCRHA